MVGLGNPGARYAGTRHNVGFRVVERLALRWRAPQWRAAAQSAVAEARADGLGVLLAMPQTFMNRSGPAIRALLGRTGLTAADTLVIHDDLDLPLGALRLRQGGGHGGHNGLRSIVDELETGGFLRLKVGIGRPAPGGDVAEYVLSPFSPDETPLLEPILDRAAQAAETAVLEGAVAAMNRFNGSGA